MEGKDYYAILGVSRTESISGIRKAFRELAKQHHPDRVGPESTRTFQEIVEAYQVLSDPQKRAAYNQRLRVAEEQRRKGTTETRGGAYRASAWTGSPFSFWSEMEQRSAPFASPFRRQPLIWEHTQHLHVEVILSPEEAVSGGVLPLAVPITLRCPSCRGSGQEGLFRCHYCGGEGRITTEDIVQVRIPPRVQEGTILEIPFSRFDASYLLSVRVRVRGGWGRYASW